MTKLLVVFGATGQQGGSIVDVVLQDPELSKMYKIRAITRNVSSEGSKKLEARGVEVFAANPDEEYSLRPAMKDAHTVFAMTFPDYSKPIKDTEIAQGRAMVDAAIAEGVQYYIYSTLPHVSKISNGKYTKVEGFDGKAEVEQYIRSKKIKSAFFAPGSFMQNFHQIMRPQKMPDGTYSIARHVSPQTQLPLIDIVKDTGKFIGAVLAEPEKYEGQTFCAATKLYTMEQQVEILSRATGKHVVYSQIPEDVFKSFLPPVAADGLVEMMSFQQDFGYYGADTENLVAWAAKNARGELTTFEQYFEQNPLALE